MRFGAVPLEQALGAVLAHGVDLRGGPLRKGCRLGAGDLARMAAEGWADVVVARLDAGDVAEDEAAARLAAALLPADEGLALTTPVNGRVNLKALYPGVVGMDAQAVRRLNRLDPAMTLATLPPFARVVAGTLVGTVKIITYAVPGATLEAAMAVAAGAVRVRPVVYKTAGLLLTEVPGTGDKLTQKGKRAVEHRLRALGMVLAEVRVVRHDAALMADALRDLQGDMLLLPEHAQILAYVRAHKDERILCAFNMSDASTSFDLPSGYRVAAVLEESKATGAALANADGASIAFKPWGVMFARLA